MTNLTLENCAFFLQLESGRWAGSRFHHGIIVSVDIFDKGVRPDRFKFEPARTATAEEKEEFNTRVDEIERNLVE